MTITRDTLVKLLSNLGSKKEVEQYLKQYCSADTQRFALIKVGGSALDEALDTVGSSIAFLQQVGLTPIVVHGAAAHVDRALAESGIATPRLDEIRCVSPEAFEVVRRVLQRENLALVDALAANGCDARPIVGEVFEVEPIDVGRYGLRGRVSAVDDTSIMAAVRAGKLPVVTCLGATRGGQLLSISSDEAASALAQRFQPHKIIFLTSTGGLMDEEQRVISAINLTEDYERLMAQPWVSGGMRRKLAHIHQLLSRLPHATVSISAPDKLARELFTHRGAGTLVSRGERVETFDRFEDIEREKLQNLVESCFGRRLTPGYFEKKRCHRVYVTEDYRATAILTSEAGLVYLDKFAVTRKAQGEGLGGSVWDRMRRDNPKVFWRSQTVNPVNGWYFQQADGSYRTPKWTVFWYGMEGFEEIERCVRTALEMPASLKDHGVDGD
ncbi:MAG: acetylglutamate kinase [Deltaproteobacteria bacterium]|nr:acetylglutamate kinase [Deltaproteobacteria bacterium]